MPFELIAQDFLVVDYSLLSQPAAETAGNLIWCPSQHIEPEQWNDVVAIKPDDWYNRYLFAQLSYLELPSRFMAEELLEYLESEKLCLMPLSCLAHCVKSDLIPKGLRHVLVLVPIKYDGCNLVFRFDCAENYTQTFRACAEYSFGRFPTAVLVGRLVEQQLKPE